VKNHEKTIRVPAILDERSMVGKELQARRDTFNNLGVLLTLLDTETRTVRSIRVDGLTLTSAIWELFNPDDE